MPWFSAILLPRFPLQAALRLRETGWKEAGCVVDGSTDKGRVLDATDAAAEWGVRSGMAATQALARCPALRLWSRTPAQEEALAALLVETAFTLSPFVEATGDELCVLDLRQVKASDWRGWAHAVVERCESRQMRAQVGVAANPDLAVLAAQRAEPALVVQHPDAFLATVSVAELHPPAEIAAVLHDWGIRHLGELAQLPRHDLTERLGPEAGRLWEHATGRMRRELQLVRPREVFFEAFDFEQEIETTEPLLFILRRQLEALTRRLREAYRVAAQMTLTIPLENGSAYERLFTIPLPTCDEEVLLRILHTHLESLRLEHHPTGVRLRIDPTIGEARQRQMFESALRDPNRFGETLARLTALVGEGNVGVAEMLDTHRPDAFRLVPPQFEKLSAEMSSPREETRAYGLPLRRFRPPIKAQVELRHYIPAFVFAGHVRGEVIAASGPYRASGNWWEGGGWAAEEWDVELPEQWLYRLSNSVGEWQIEGSYGGPFE